MRCYLEISIWKYPLAVKGGPQRLDMPRGAQLLLVHEQNGVPTIWALVDPDAVMETRSFFVIGTGFDFGSNGYYVGSAFCGIFVWHVFEGEP